MIMMNQTQIFVLSVTQPGIDALVEQHRGYLSEDECSRESRIKPVINRKLFVVSRILLRHQLGIRLGRDPASFNFEIEELGKPVLQDSCSVEFNISHSHRQLAIAIGSRTLGIDLEYVKRKNNINKIAKRFFTESEFRQMEVSSHPGDLFFSLWTLKEAYMKALGSGLTHGLASFEFDLTDGIDFNDETRNKSTVFYSCRLMDDYHVSLCELDTGGTRPEVFNVDSGLVSKKIEPVRWLS